MPLKLERVEAYKVGGQVHPTRPHAAAATLEVLFEDVNGNLADALATNAELRASVKEVLGWLE